MVRKKGLSTKLRSGGGYPAGNREPAVFSEVRNDKKGLICQADNSGGSEYRKLEKIKTKARETRWSEVRGLRNSCYARHFPSEYSRSKTMSTVCLLKQWAS